MSRQVILTTQEAEILTSLGQRLRLARLRRNLTQDNIAERAGVSRKTIVTMEAGAPGTSIAVLAKVMSILGYPERVADLLASDPLGEGMEAVSGRKRAKGRGDVADF